MKFKQKLGLGVFLCLSVFMIITAIVRISGLAITIQPPNGKVKAFDVIWKAFWQQVEACVAVLMVSFTAFRSIFVAESSKKNRDRAKQPCYSSHIRIRNLRRADAWEEQGDNGLLAVSNSNC